MPRRGAASDVFSAIADPTRRRLLDLLSERERDVSDLAACFEISLPAVSQHLAALKDAGLVDSRREGRRVFYRVEPRGMKPLIDWIAYYQAFWTEHIGRLEQLLENMDE